MTERIIRRRVQRGVARQTCSISIPLPLLGVVDRYAEAREITRNMALVELISAASPALEQTTEALELARRSPQLGVERIKESLTRAMAAASGVQKELTL